MVSKYIYSKILITFISLFQEQNNNKAEDSSSLLPEEILSALIAKELERDASEIDITEEKARTLFCFDDAPEYLRFNPFIKTGYRGLLNTKYCVER